MLDPVKTLMKATAVGVLAFSASAMTAAADFPEKPMTLIFFFPGGGSGDAQARAAAHGLSQIMGQNMVVRNVAGGSGTVGLVGMMRERPDGYTLGYLPEGLATIQPLRNELPYTYESFDPVCRLTFMPVAIFGRTDAPYSNLQEMVEYARDNEITYGHPGVGTVPHFAMENFLLEAGINARSVPFNGDGPGTTAIRGGHVDLYVSGSPAITVLAGDDTRVLGVFGSKRMASAPDAPTAAEQGYDLSAGVAFGIVGPKGLDQTAKAKLSEGCQELAESEEFAESVANLSAVVDYADGPGFEAYLREREAVYRDLMTKLGLIEG